MRTPTSVLVGNGFDGFLSAICVFDFSSSLSMFGCGCSWNDLFVGPCRKNEIDFDSLKSKI